MPPFLSAGEPMFGNSRSVSSAQQGIHPRLDQVVSRHRDQVWRKPVADHTRTAFARCQRWLRDCGRADSLILDSGCGTGRSSLALAQAFPDHAVIGIDQSGHRLSRLAHEGVALPANLMLVRAECADFWRLAREAGWSPRQHKLFYPNPWPKPAQLQRRWHGHPVWPELLALGGELEVRSNWPLYLQEMSRALALCGWRASLEEVDAQAAPVSEFERKYRASGQVLLCLKANLAE